MNIPLVDLRAQYARIAPEIDAAMRAVIEKTAFIGGPFVREFETAFAEFCQAPHAVGCANGTDAIMLVLRALGIGPGDEVIVPSHTFFATPEAVLQAGAVPVYVDIEEGGCTMDPASTEAAITERTKAIMPVHLYGYPCDMDALTAIAKKHDLRVIEDSAQAHGALDKGRPIGLFGDAGTFSFYPGKNLGAYGDAGAVITRDADLAEHISRLRNHARQGKWEHDEMGVNSRLDGLQAAILSAKLKHLAAWSEERRAAAALYDAKLAGLDGVEPVRPRAETLPVYHLYVVRVDASRRDAVLAGLKERGVGASMHYPIPCHLQPAVRDADGNPPVRLPRTERMVDEIISLPMFPELTEEQIDAVVNALAEVLG